MRIALCSYSSGAANGIAHMDKMLLQHIQEAGHNVRLIVIRADNTHYNTSHENIIYINIEEALFVLPRLFKHVDVVQFNGSFDPVVTQSAVEAGVPAIVEVMHNTEQGGMFSEIDAIVCVSSVVQQVQTSIKTCIIHNGIPTEHFPLKLGRHSDDGLVILQIANNYKSLHIELEEILPELQKYYPGVRAIHAGGRGGPLAKDIDNVGVVVDTCPLYHAADVLFLPSVHDAFGLVLAEAQASGCLVIGNKHTGARDIIKDSVTGWLVDNDRSAMLTALHTALHTVTTQKLEAIQQRACDSTRSLFDAKACVQKYLHLYTTLLSTRKRKLHFSAKAWQPLLIAAFYCAHDIEKALYWLCRFINNGHALEPVLLHHTNGHAALRIGIRLAELLRQSGEKSYPSAFCKLLRTSKVVMPELLLLEASLN